MRRLALAFLFTFGCGEEAIEDGDDHSADRLVLEGQQIVDLLGDDAVSDPIASAGFRRLGVLWDATGENALEIRTSVDGLSWTDWTAPQVISREDVAHAGHVDAIDIGRLGSTDNDPKARWYQLRAPAGSPATFLLIEPLVDIPAFEPEPAISEDIANDPTEIAAVVSSTPIGSIKIHSRADWGARRPRCSSGSMTPNRATIHHTVTPTTDSMTPQQRLRQIQAFHMFSRGWCDIGYNFLVSRDGRVWKGRGPRTIGAHAENANTGNVGISFIGTYTSTAPTQTQMCQTAKLLRRLHMDYSGLSLNRTDVRGHRQVGTTSTSCPGNALYNRIDAILSKARNGC